MNRRKWERVMVYGGVKMDANSKPFRDVRISRCGELVLQLKNKGEW